jgi:hypothetical protein
MSEATRLSEEDEHFIQLLRTMTPDELKFVRDGAVDIARAVSTPPDRRTSEQTTLAMRHSVWLDTHKLQ